MNNEEFVTGVENHKKRMSTEEMLDIRLLEIGGEIGYCLNILTILEDALECRGTLEAAMEDMNQRLERATVEGERIIRTLYPDDPDRKIDVVGYGDTHATAAAINATREAGAKKNAEEEPCSPIIIPPGC